MRFLTLLLTILIASCNGACSGSQVHQQAIAASAIAKGLNAALVVAVDVYRRQQIEVITEACGHATPCAAPDEARAAVRVIRARWAPVWLAWELARDAHDAWADQLDHCQEDSDKACVLDLRSLQSSAMETLGKLRCLLVAVKVPDPLEQFGALTCSQDSMEKCQ